MTFLPPNQHLRIYLSEKYTLPPHVCVCLSDNAASVRIRPPLLQQSIDISCPPGPQQQTCSSGVRRPDWTDGRTDRHRQTNGGPIVAQTLLRILCGQCQNVKLLKQRASKRESYTDDIHKQHATHAPPYLALSFTCVADMPHRRRLRSASTEQLDVPTCRRSTIRGRAFPVAGAKVWNGLPSDATSASSLSVFKNRLETYLFRRCCETV